MKETGKKNQPLFKNADPEYDKEQLREFYFETYLKEGTGEDGVSSHDAKNLANLVKTLKTLESRGKAHGAK